MSDIKLLDGESIRDSVDARDRYELLRAARIEARHSFGGSMKFESRGEAEYLIRRPYGSSTRKSLGRRSRETEAILAKFTEGKARVDERIEGLRKQLEDRAPILRARGLGRVPLLAARVMRKLDDLGWLGISLIVVGTNALYAYEARAGVRIETGMLATGDVDVLYDARRKLVMSGEIRENGLIGALQAVDRSFSRSDAKTYTAANKDGYMVDLIEPQDHDRLMRGGPSKLSDHPDDLVAISTDSSKWLLNVPKFEGTAFDERGLPVRIVTLDPRVYALQKQWIVENDWSRDPAKRTRDWQQAQLVALMATRHLGLSFDDDALSGLPKSFRDLAQGFDDSAGSGTAEW
ncbi:nucleotidyltransferase domain-containing protein [Oricola sp.]|uniref:nucleotidyltransferase family protein n=1 Tax=Oricola sp. TaxID=1979950 RepID=UPI0025DFE679|nr:nucleotidyltransferase domain-containing protein [Oricola sp.]MCI5078235.1 nucleotidyltransferase domain-containing protein [Oricola sp.]